VFIESDFARQKNWDAAEAYDTSAISKLGCSSYDEGTFLCFERIA
jgi:hypothetical protein